MMNKSAVRFGLMVALISMSACRTPTDDGSVKSEEVATHEEASRDSCDNVAMAKRRSATFNRSAACAADAVGFGLADVVQKASLAAGELKAFAAAARKVQGLFNSAGIKASLNTTRAAYCASVLLGDYAAVRTIGYIGSQAINKSFQEDLAPLSKLAAIVATAGGTEVWESIHHLIEHPSVETLLKIGTTSTISITDVSMLVATCGQAFVQAGVIDSKSIIQIVGFKEHAAKIGVAAAVANCAAAGLFNAIDVSTEAYCLVKDLEALSRQEAEIKAAEQSACENLKSMASDPKTRSILQDTQMAKHSSESKNRDRICRSVVFSWGRCLATHKVETRTEVYCKKLCEGDNIAVQDDFDKIVKAAQLGSSKDIRPLVSSTTRHCITPGNSEQLVKDGLQPCVNLCVEGKGGEKAVPSFDHSL